MWDTPCTVYLFFVVDPLRGSDLGVSDSPAASLVGATWTGTEPGTGKGTNKDKDKDGDKDRARAREHKAKEP